MQWRAAHPFWRDPRQRTIASRPCSTRRYANWLYSCDPQFKFHALLASRSRPALVAPSGVLASSNPARRDLNGCCNEGSWHNFVKRLSPVASPGFAAKTDVRGPAQERDAGKCALGEEFSPCGFLLFLASLSDTLGGGILICSKVGYLRRVLCSDLHYPRISASPWSLGQRCAAAQWIASFLVVLPRVRARMRGGAGPTAGLLVGAMALRTKAIRTRRQLRSLGRPLVTTVQKSVRANSIATRWRRRSHPMT
jgi:hypothetical protein